MTPPIFIVCANGDLYAYRAPEDAAADLESPDVEAGEYIAAFDAVGTRLRIDVAEPTHRSDFLGMTSVVLSPIRISAASADAAGAVELCAVLVQRFPGCSEQHSLAQLVEHAATALLKD
jgi:hypothetical protein